MNFMYSPRGDPRGRDKWLDALTETMRQCQPSIPAAVLSGPPKVTQVEVDMPKATTEEVNEEYNRRLSVFQGNNTALWDVARPSISLDGAYHSMDMAHIKLHYMIGEFLDGHGLVEWVKDVTKTDHVEDQIQAVRELADFKALDSSKEITRVHLDVFLSTFVSKWQAVGSNATFDTARMEEFRARLLSLLPDEPMTAKIVFLRQHLVDRIAAGSTEVASPAGIIKLMSERALAIAMPKGDPTTAAGALVPFVGGKSLPKEKKEPGEKKPGTDKQPKGRPRKGKNDCPKCPLDLCLAAQWADAAKKAGKTVKDIAEYCLVCKGVDPRNIPYYPKTGSEAPTTSEVFALQVMQKAYTIDPTIDLKNLPFIDVKKFTYGDSQKAPSATGQQSTPVVCMSSLISDVSSPAEFQEWAASLGFDMLTPVVQVANALIGTGAISNTAGEDNGAGAIARSALPAIEELPDQEVSSTPAYQWTAAPADEAAAVRAALADTVETVRSDMREEMAERLAQQQAQFDEQIARLQRAAQQPPTAPAPPASVPMHMRPIYSTTPVVNPALAQMQSRGIQAADLAPATSTARRSGRVAPTGAELIALGMADYERRLANARK